MLTLILLVVLGGGAGLMAVWLIDARGLSRLLSPSGGTILRRPRRRGTAPDPTPGADQTTSERRFEPLVPLPAVTADALAYEAVDVPPGPAPAPSAAGRRDGKRVPSAYTAVEGSYRDVARVPMWRKLISLLSLLGVLVVVGVVIAALAGATFGAIAELVNGAVG